MKQLRKGVGERGISGRRQQVQQPAEREPVVVSEELKKDNKVKV